MSEVKHHISSYKSHLVVLATLLVLTVLTVWVAGFDLQMLTVAVALTIASVKGYVVAAYFMHLKFDNKLLGILFSIVMLVFATLIIMTLIDYIYR